MKNNTKIEIILSVLGFSILFYILQYLIPNMNDINLYERLNADTQYINKQTTVFPVYKQDKKTGGLRDTNSYKTPFKTTSGIFSNETLLAQSTNQVHTQETSGLLNTNYAVSMFPTNNREYSSNMIVNDSYTPVHRSGKGTTVTATTAHGFSKLSTWNNPQSNNRPFYAGEAIDDLILVDPMADPDEAERIPAGSNPWILLIFASIYGFYKNRKLYFGKAPTKNKI